MITHIWAAVAALAVLALPAAAAAAPISYRAFLDGPSEEPPNTSPGTGSARLVIDTEADFYRLTFSFEGLLAGTTAVHIHGPTLLPFEGTASVMTTTPSFPGFPAGVTSGTYGNTFDTTAVVTWNPSFVTSVGDSIANAEAAFAAALADGKAYLNIHTSAFPSGEIRGFFTPAPAPIPIPAGLPLLATGLVAFAALRRRA